MPHLTQRLVNNFPGWTKIRKDPSTFGFRFFSVYADYFDLATVEIKKLSTSRNLLQKGMGLPYIWSIQLDEVNFMTPEINKGGSITWNYPTTVTGVNSGGSQVLTRVESIEELLWSVPDTIDQVDSVGVDYFLIYDSDVPSVINTIAYPERLIIVVSGSTSYLRKKATENRFLSGRPKIFIEGYDINDMLFTEHMVIPDDGVFITQNAFFELEEIVSSGFDGRIQIYLATATDYIVDEYHAVVNEELEGQLKLRTNVLTYLVDYGYLQYFTDILKQGTSYRNGVIPDLENEEVIWEQHLLDENSNTYIPRDLAVNPNSTRLYVLDTSNKIHIYNHEINTFDPCVDESSLTRNSFVQVQPLKSWALLGETQTMFTWFARPIEPILSVTVYRRNPNGDQEWLQDDLTWNTVSNSFAANAGIQSRPEDTWKDITFECEFDLIGQWEFYCETQTPNETTLYYSGVLVDSLVAEKTLDTEITDLTSIYFGFNDHLYVSDVSTVYEFQEYSDKYLANPQRQQLLVREEYTSVEVV